MRSIIALLLVAILAGPGVPDPGEPPTLPGDQVTVTYEQMNAYLEREIKGWQPA